MDRQAYLASDALGPHNGFEGADVRLGIHTDFQRGFINAPSSMCGAKPC